MNKFTIDADGFKLPFPLILVVFRLQHWRAFTVSVSVYYSILLITTKLYFTLTYLFARKCSYSGSVY